MRTPPWCDCGLHTENVRLPPRNIPIRLWRAVACTAERCGELSQGYAFFAYPWKRYNDQHTHPGGGASNPRHAELHITRQELCPWSPAAGRRQWPSWRKRVRRTRRWLGLTASIPIGIQLTSETEPVLRGRDCRRSLVPRRERGSESARCKRHPSR